MKTNYKLQDGCNNCVHAKEFSDYNVQGEWFCLHLNDQENYAAKALGLLHAKRITDWQAYYDWRKEVIVLPEGICDDYRKDKIAGVAQ